MLFKNLRIGWRNIKKNGIFSIINITGLSLGIAVVTLILFWVVDEINYDRFHKNIDRIYTVYEHQQYSEGQELFTYCTPFPLGKEFITNFSEVENATTFANAGEQLIRFEDREYKEGPVVCTDSEFLNIFSFEVVQGDKNALEAPDKIVIDEELAAVLFGNESAIGKIVKINDNLSYSVGAVVKTEKLNTTINFKILAPLNLAESFGADLTRWGNNWPRTSILLSQNANIGELNSKITNFLKEKGQENTTLYLFPFQNERLHSYSGKNNRIQYIYQFLGIAFIIILIASINFINLSTAKAEQRRPEVGIRKVLGANKVSILSQFLQEKGIMIVLSLLLSAILVLAFTPAFRSVSDKIVTFSLLGNKYMLLMLLGVISTVLVLSVVYPSLYISSFNPAQAMKKTRLKKQGKVGAKNLLVIVQFVLSVVLISSTLIITRQLKYINNYDLGYDQANLIYIPLNGEAKNNHEALRQELTGISGVVSLTRSSRVPFYGGSSSWGYDWEGKDPENRVLICSMNADRNYFETLGIQFADGNNFPENYSEVLDYENTPSPQVILNEESIRRMKIKNPVGKYFGRNGGEERGVIAGVAKDFHFQSLHNGVEPMVIMPLFENPGYIIARINPENFTETINEIKKSWAKVLPQSICEIKFFDDSLESMYNSEVKISALFKYFSFIAIFISCIGLFALSLYIIELRKKEIGVRKVNGAKIGEVILLLNQDFIRWVVIAFIIACPIAWLIMDKWLENFAFKTNLSWWVFLIAGALALIIAMVTVSYQSYRAAVRNPVEALRYE
ncbi:ABC transporter permease [Maribellus maritimus]|uniref:ABC transporter permease n=1 Tax=Maribellus maritimus TaxID=2870838 RepID=UPI001EEB8FC6|nr:ABC transporter permease [Maribellus maritimus]MCG6188713.1 ABC transporter permease [Maribellus maritimus]